MLLVSSFSSHLISALSKQNYDPSIPLKSLLSCIHFNHYFTFTSWCIDFSWLWKHLFSPCYLLFFLIVVTGSSFSFRIELNPRFSSLPYLYLLSMALNAIFSLMDSSHVFIFSPLPLRWSIIICISVNLCTHTCMNIFLLRSKISQSILTYLFLLYSYTTHLVHHQVLSVTNLTTSLDLCSFTSVQATSIYLSLGLEPQPSNLLPAS